jgi:hypothetical protein
MTVRPDTNDNPGRRWLEQIHKEDAEYRQQHECPELRQEIDRRGLRLHILDASRPYRAIDPDGNVFEISDEMRRQLRFMVFEDARRYLYEWERFPHLVK